mmetsp:Transcript_9127/g.27462  ORF Transcript_9127/g.27462 Transcript_9127/m.27462 type:complete len:283 (+) Transcript_9127:32-880(+)
MGRERSRAQARRSRREFKEEEGSGEGVSPGDGRWDPEQQPSGQAGSDSGTVVGSKENLEGGADLPRRKRKVGPEGSSQRSGRSMSGSAGEKGHQLRVGRKRSRIEEERVSESESSSDIPGVENTDFVSRLAHVVNGVISRSGGKGKHKADLPKCAMIRTFYSSSRQPFSVDFYIRRLMDCMGCSKSAFIVMFIYLDRFLSCRSGLVVSEYNVHRLMLTALILAAKFVDDTVHSNTYYARVGGITTTSEINKLELTMLYYLKFKLFVDPDVFRKYDQVLGGHL